MGENFNKKTNNIVLIVSVVIALLLGGYAVKLTVTDKNSKPQSKVAKPGPVTDWFLHLNQGDVNLNTITQKLITLGSFRDAPKGELCKQIGEDLKYFSDHMSPSPEKNIDSKFKLWSDDQIKSLDQCQKGYSTGDREEIKIAEKDLLGSIKLFTDFNSELKNYISRNK